MKAWLEAECLRGLVTRLVSLSKAALDALSKARLRRVSRVANLPRVC